MRYLLRSPILYLVLAGCICCRLRRRCRGDTSRSSTTNTNARPLLRPLWSVVDEEPPAAAALCHKHLRPADDSPSNYSPMLCIAAHGGGVDYMAEKLATGLETSVGRVAVDINEVDPFGNDATALLWAVQGGQDDAVKLLLRAKADVNKADRSGLTPLHVAADLGRENALRQLLAAGANVNRAAKSGDTPLRLATAPAIKTALQAAVARQQERQGVQQSTTLLTSAHDNGGKCLSGSSLDVSWEVASAPDAQLLVGVQNTEAQNKAPKRQPQQPGPQQSGPQTRTAAAVTFAEKPRTFTQNFAKAVEYSPMVGARSAAYDRGSDLTDVLAGLRQVASDPKAVDVYTKAGTDQQYKDLEVALTHGLSGLEHTTRGKAPRQLMKNVMTAYTMETYFGGMRYSVLNTYLREQKEYPAMAPVAKLLHHAVSELAASDEYGYDGVSMRAMKLPEDVISQYKVHKDFRLNIFSWSGFTSCTTDPTTCLNTFVDSYKLNVIFVIHSGNARQRPMKIDQWSKFPKEKEVLFDVRFLFHPICVVPLIYLFGSAARSYAKSCLCAARYAI
jgi:hypothetical protein